MKLRSACLVAAALPLAACSVVLGGGVDSCGEHPEGGGPAVIATRDQELCEVVRIRVARALLDDPKITYGMVDDLREKSAEWEGKRTFESLLVAIRHDAGDMTADAVKRAVDAVTAQSKRPLRPECGDAERCLVKGAVKGARLALMNMRPWSPSTPDAPPDK